MDLRRHGGALFVIVHCTYHRLRHPHVEVVTVPEPRSEYKVEIKKYWGGSGGPGAYQTMYSSSTERTQWNQICSLRPGLFTHARSAEAHSRDLHHFLSLQRNQLH